MGENMVANGEHVKISIGRVLVSVSTPHCITESSFFVNVRSYTYLPLYLSKIFTCLYDLKKRHFFSIYIYNYHELFHRHLTKMKMIPKNVSETTGSGGETGLVVIVTGTVVVGVVVVGAGGVGGGRGTYVVAGRNGFDRMLALLTADGTR